MRLDFAGWERFEELRRAKSDSHRAFMAMQFNEAQLNDAFGTCFKPAAADIPFADDGGTPAWRARHASPYTPRFPVWRFLLAVAALPPLLAFMAAASWLAWMCFQGVMRPPGSPIAGIAALAALTRRHTGMEVDLALCLIAVVGLVAVVWVVFALLAVALVAGCEAAACPIEASMPFASFRDSCGLTALVSIRAWCCCLERR